MSEKIFLGETDTLQGVKNEIGQDVHKAVHGAFYIGDTGLDGRLVAHVGGNLHNVINMLVNAGLQNEALRHILLVTSTHLK